MKPNYFPYDPTPVPTVETHDTRLDSVQMMGETYLYHLQGFGHRPSKSRETAEAAGTDGHPEVESWEETETAVVVETCVRVLRLDEPSPHAPPDLSGCAIIGCGTNPSKEHEGINLGSTGQFNSESADRIQRK